MKKSDERQPHLAVKHSTANFVYKKDNSERGAAMLVALIVIAAFIVLATAASKTVTAISREAERAEQTRQEKSRAEYYMSMAEATLKYDVRQTYNDFQSRGKQMELQLQGEGKLPMFDPLTVSTTKPLLTIEGEHTGESPSTATSLYGYSGLWTRVALDRSRQYISSKIIEKGISAPDAVEITAFKEVYRRITPDFNEPIYAFRYTVRTHAGEFGEVVREDLIHLGPIIMEDSTIIANCADLTLTGAANPPNVAWGNSTSLELNYTSSEILSIYNSSGSLIFNQPVSIEPTTRMISYPTGSLTGPTTFVGEAVRGSCQIQVQITVGVTFNQNISYTVNGSQTINIIEGDMVRYDWNVNDAAAGYTSSYITYGNSPEEHHVNVYSNSINQIGPTQSMTSTLHVRDTRFNGGSEQTATVNINVCRLPRIVNFTVSPPSVTQGGNQDVEFSWQIQQAAAMRIIRSSDNQVIFEGSQMTGSWVMPQPQASTEYRLEAISSCGAAASSSSTTVTVTNRTCESPLIANFGASPANVALGGNENVTLSWSVTGEVESMNISGVGNVSGSYAIIPQPQTTTIYVLTVNGCGSSPTANTTVTVGGGNPPTVRTAERELAQNGGVYSCRTGNEFRVANGFRPIPCTNWTTNLVVSIVREPAGTYLITATKTSNVDSSPDFRARNFVPQIGIFGSINPFPCAPYDTMCFENRERLGYWSGFYVSNETGHIVSLDWDPANRTASWRVVNLPPGAEYIVFDDPGSPYTIYFQGYDYGGGDRQSAGEYQYFYVGNCCATGGIQLPFSIGP